MKGFKTREDDSVEKISKIDCFLIPYYFTGPYEYKVENLWIDNKLIKANKVVKYNKSKIQNSKIFKDLL